MQTYLLNNNFSGFDTEMLITPELWMHSVEMFSCEIYIFYLEIISEARFVLFFYTFLSLCLTLSVFLQCNFNIGK